MTTQQQNNTELTEIQKKREKLKEYSAQVKPLIEEGEFEKINDAIIDTIHKNEKHNEFKTFKQWRSEGYRVKKGSKAFLIWGKPKKKDKDKETDEDESKRDFFPVAFLFSNAQVTKSK